jgi:hypothetical protein
LGALRDEAGWSYKHFQYWPNKCINENKQFFVDGRVEEISTRIHVSEVADYPVFDATLGGALLGRTFTRTEADAMIHIIETSVHGGTVNGIDEAILGYPIDPPIGVQCGQCGGTKGIHYRPCDGKVKGNDLR